MKSQKIKRLEYVIKSYGLAHNHPSGDTTPSPADIRMTQQIAVIAESMGISVHDHLIVGRHGHASLKSLQLL